MTRTWLDLILWVGHHKCYMYVRNLFYGVVHHKCYMYVRNVLLWDRGHNTIYVHMSLIGDVHFVLKR